MTIAIFSKDELHILRKIWEDLSEKSGSDNTDHMGVNKETFLKYIPINGLLGERIFTKFARKDNKFIDFEDFIFGLSILCLGTLNEQTKFLFDICNVHDDNLIPKKDLITLLNYIPKHILCNSCSVRTRTLSTICQQSQSTEPIDSIGLTDYVGFIDYTNSCVCANAFVHYEDFLDYEDFSNWIKKTPAILGYIKSVIPCLAEDTIQVDNDKLYLWKKGEKTGLMFKRYYLLCGNCLYYYYGKTDIRPKGIIFLPGSIVERISNKEMEDKNMFGFDIIQQNLCTGEYHHHEKRTFYCMSENQVNELVHKLQVLSNLIPFEEEYTIGKQIGIGAFSEVFECTEVNKPENVYAVKVIDKKIFKNIKKEQIFNEIAILKLLDHPNVIHLINTYESKTHFYIVIELIKDGDFFEYISNKPCFDENSLKNIIRQLLEAVAYLHEYGIVHCDIKPENILYDKTTGNIIKLTDFGLSRMIFSDQKINTPSGTLAYIAPEALTNVGYGVESDLWSVGIIMYLLVHGRLPFDEKIQSDMVEAILNKKPPIKQTLSVELKDILTKLLEKNPTNRISAKEALNHPFFIRKMITESQ